MTRAPRTTIKPFLGQGHLAPVTDAARTIAEALPEGGTVFIAADGTPLLVVPYVPLQVSRLVPHECTASDHGPEDNET